MVWLQLLLVTAQWLLVLVFPLLLPRLLHLHLS